MRLQSHGIRFRSRRMFRGNRSSNRSSAFPFNLIFVVDQQVDQPVYVGPQGLDMPGDADATILPFKQYPFALVQILIAATANVAAALT